MDTVSHRQAQGRERDRHTSWWFPQPDGTPAVPHGSTVGGPYRRQPPRADRPTAGQNRCSSREWAGPQTGWNRCSSHGRTGPQPDRTTAVPAGGQAHSRSELPQLPRVGRPTASGSYNRTETLQPLRAGQTHSQTEPLQPLRAGWPTAGGSRQPDGTAAAPTGEQAHSQWLRQPDGTTAAPASEQAHNRWFPPPDRTTAAPTGEQAHSRWLRQPDGTAAAPEGRQARKPVVPAARPSPRGRAGPDPVAFAAGRNPCGFHERARPYGWWFPPAAKWTSCGPTDRPRQARRLAGPVVSVAGRNRCGSPTAGPGRDDPTGIGSRGRNPGGAGNRLRTAQPNVAPRHIVYRTAGTISREPIKRGHSE